MKIDFERVYFDEKENYLLFRSNPEKFYLLRVMDFNGGERFAEAVEERDKIEPGSGVIAEYLLTKEEFDLWDTDEEEFKAIVDNLCKTAPPDRLLKIYWQRTPKAPQIPLKVKTGEVTGNDTNLVEEMKNLFQFERNSDIAKFKDFLRGKLESDIYFVYSKHIRNIFPAVDFEGKMFFIEGEKQAESFTEATRNFGNQYRKVSGGEAKEIVENCKRYGVFKILFIKEDGEGFVMDRDELLDSPTENKWDTYNSDIYNLLMRCIECAEIPDPNVRANQMTLTSQLSHRIFKTTFIVSVAQSKEKPKNTVWLSSGAEKLRKEKEFFFDGTKDFTYTPAPEEKFIIRTLVNTKDNSMALPVFTDLQEFNMMLGESDDVPLAVTLEEISTMKNEQVKTVLLNPATLGFIFTDGAMKQFTEMSQQPPMVFEPQKLTQPSDGEITIGDAEDSGKSTAVNIPIIPQEASTESILNMVASQLDRENAVKKENITAAEKKEDNRSQTSFTLHENAETDTETVSDKEEKADAAASKNEKKGGFFSRFRKKK